MIKILVVEDEVNAREGLVFLIRQKISCCTVYEAVDGMDGLKQCETYKPNIIITDIRMPRMGGIDMIQQLRSKNYSTQFIILSGYAEFQYAQAALALGVTGYLLKPLVPSMVFELLEKCFELIRREKPSDVGDRDDVDMFSERDTNLIARFYGNLDIEKYLIGQIYSQQPALLRDDIKKLCDENSNLLILNFQDGCFIGFIVPCKDSDDWLLHRIRSIVDRYRSSACAYSFSNTLDSLFNRLEKVRKAIKWSISTGNSMIFEEKAVQTGELGSQDDNNFKKTFHKLCLSNNYEKCLSILLKYLCQLQGKGLNPEIIIQSAISCLLQFNGEKSFTEQINMCCFEAVNNILSSYCFYEIESNVSSYFQCVLNSQSNLPVFSKPVNAVIDEINRFYNQPISLNSIADKLGVTPQYLSRIFAQETNKNFIDYLTAVRIEKAKFFIKNTDLKIYEIAEQVGYPDSKYFCTLFKKVAGISPHQYKRIANSQEN